MMPKEKNLFFIKKNDVIHTYSHQDASDVFKIMKCTSFDSKELSRYTKMLTLAGYTCHFIDQVSNL